MHEAVAKLRRSSVGGLREANPLLTLTPTTGKIQPIGFLRIMFLHGLEHPLIEGGGTSNLL